MYTPSYNASYYMDIIAWMRTYLQARVTYSMKRTECITQHYDQVYIFHDEYVGYGCIVSALHYVFWLLNKFCKLQLL